MAYDEQYMRLAIELAKKGVGAVDPNPLVGAVIVKNNEVIGSGYHKKYGDLHAERDAFRNLTQNAEGSEMYVTLEPCCHYGKQPPCVDAIIEHKIKTVYVGSDDPNELVSGKGYNILRSNGIEVITHCLKDECDQINRVFFHYITKQTPYVVMKYGMTIDGKISTRTSKSKWITSEKSRNDTQLTRNQLTGIMVGIGTVIADDPMLNCRIEGGRNPVRIVCDSKLRIPLNSKIVETSVNIPTYVATTVNDSDKIKQLEDKGIKVIQSSNGNGRVDLNQLMNILGSYKINSVLLEGGGTLNYSALEAGIVNELNVYIAPKIFGGNNSKTPVDGLGVESPDDAFMFDLVEQTLIDQDIFLRYIRKEGA